MSTHQARSANRARPHLWPALLSLLVALTLVFQPSQLCALMESSHSHSHSHSHLHEAAEEQHESAAHYDVDHHDAKDVGAHHGQGRLSVAPSSRHQADCCDDETQPQVAVSASRRSAPDGIPVFAVAPAVFAATLAVFGPTSRYGRDGPPGTPLRSQLVPSSLLGRAPPVSA